jgi:hypothetical protein
MLVFAVRIFRLARLGYAKRGLIICLRPSEWKQPCKVFKNQDGLAMPKRMGYIITVKGDTDDRLEILPAYGLGRKDTL